MSMLHEVEGDFSSFTLGCDASAVGENTALYVNGNGFVNGNLTVSGKLITPVLNIGDNWRIEVVPDDPSAPKNNGRSTLQILDSEDNFSSFFIATTSTPPTYVDYDPFDLNLIPTHVSFNMKLYMSKEHTSGIGISSYNVAVVDSALSVSLIPADPPNGTFSMSIDGNLLDLIADKTTGKKEIFSLKSPTSIAVKCYQLNKDTVQIEIIDIDTTSLGYIGVKTPGIVLKDRAHAYNFFYVFTDITGLALAAKGTGTEIATISTLT